MKLNTKKTEGECKCSCHFAPKDHKGFGCCELLNEPTEKPRCKCLFHPNTHCPYYVATEKPMDWEENLKKILTPLYLEVHGSIVEHLEKMISELIKDLLKEERENHCKCIYVKGKRIGMCLECGKREIYAVVKARAEYKQKLIKDLDERINQHKENLRLWNNGVLTPTEPDEEERELVKMRLKVAIEVLDEVEAVIKEV